MPTKKPMSHILGRRRGVPNKLGSTAKENIQRAFAHLNGREIVHLRKWAEEHPTEFYRIYAKLIPHELTGPEGEPIQIVFSELQSKGL